MSYLPYYDELLKDFSQSIVLEKIVAQWLLISIVTSSAIDKMFEIFGPIFKQNANFGPIFEKSVNFEHFVNGRWTHYKSIFHNLTYKDITRVAFWR